MDMLKQNSNLDIISYLEILWCITLTIRYWWRNQKINTSHCLCEYNSNFNNVINLNLNKFACKCYKICILYSKLSEKNRKLWKSWLSKNNMAELDAGICGTAQMEDAQLLPVPSFSAVKKDTRRRSQYLVGSCKHIHNIVTSFRGKMNIFHMGCTIKSRVQVYCTCSDQLPVSSSA